MSDNIRKIYADALASLIVAYEDEHEGLEHHVEDLEEKLHEEGGKLSDSLKEARRIEEGLKAELEEARKPHRPGSLVAQVDAEARLVKQLEQLRADKKADEDALVARVQQLETEVGTERGLRIEAQEMLTSTQASLEGERADRKLTEDSLLAQIGEWREACRKVKAERDGLRSERDQLLAELEKVKHLRGVPLMRPTVPGIVDLETAERVDATGRTS